MTSILITGGTGSWGRAMTRRLLEIEKPDRIIIYSRGEHAQEAMARELASCDPGGRLRFRIGDVRDRERLELAMRGVDLVFHAAALKIVPTCEADPSEAIKTNILGTDNVIHAALRAGVKKVMALSTDKAAAPNTLYGSTKQCAERLVVAANAYSGAAGTRFACVRYGNVIGSQGSVVPLFKRLAANGAKALPITDPRMTRFFFSIEEAVAFTLSSAEMMAGGEVFVPKISARRVVDLAREIAPHLPHEIVGIRPGEKIHEVLISEDESRAAIELSDRYVIRPLDLSWSQEHLPGARPVPEGFRFGSDDAVEPRGDGRVAARFWSKVKKAAGDQCWEWQAARNKVSGYGLFRVGSKSVGTARTVAAHRMAWELVNGPVESGLFVCHRCDNPRCVRPDHLFLGTHDENMADCTRKGRHQNGSTKAPPTHCRRGHEFTPANTRIDGKGNRVCRECTNAHARRYRQVKRISLLEAAE